MKPDVGIGKVENLSLDPEIVIDHVCRNRICVNPDHLRQVDQVTNALENTVSSALARKMQTHCKRGHEFSPDNTIVNGVGVNGGIWRKCRTCTTAKNKERWKKFKKLKGN